jgi:hypothetical protein
MMGAGLGKPPPARGQIVPVIHVAGPLPKRVPPGASTRAVVNDAFTAAGSAITVHKTIKGPQAGQQGEIVITTACGDTIRLLSSQIFHQLIDRVFGGDAPSLQEPIGSIESQ